MIKRMLHKLIVVWCLYGAVRVIIFIHPWMFWLAARVKPYFGKGDYELVRGSDGCLLNPIKRAYEHIAWDSGSFVQNLWVWGTGLAAIAVVLIFLAILSGFSNWLFNKRGDQDTIWKRMDVGQDNLIEDVKTIKEALDIDKEADKDEQ